MYGEKSIAYKRNLEKALEPHPAFSVMGFPPSQERGQKYLLLNDALKDEVIIDNEGMRYKILPVRNETYAGKSPLEDIPRMKLNVTTQEIVEILQECRAGT